MALEALGRLLMFEKGWAPVGLPLLWQISEIFKNKRSSLWLRLEVPVPCMIGPTAFWTHDEAGAHGRNMW